MTSTLPGPNIQFLQLGAIIQELRVGGINIVQNFPSAEDYQKYNSPFFGETIGRVANRISGAKIQNLNGQSYQLEANNGKNALHGGSKGWGKRIFKGPTPVNKDRKEAVVFKYTSADGEEGYPGTVDFSVTYTASTEQEGGKEKVVLEIEYEAELAGPDNVQETVINATNHRCVCLVRRSKSVH